MLERGRDRDRESEEESDMAGEEVLSSWPVCKRGRTAKGRGRALGLIEGDPGVVMLFVLWRDAKVELYNREVAVFKGPETERALDTTEARLDERL